MLTYLRKHQYGLMLVVAVIVIVAFTFFYSADSGRRGPEATKAYSVGGQTYTYADLEKMQNLAQLAQSLGFQDLFLSLASERLVQSSGGTMQAFIYNLTVFRQEAPKLGLEVSDAEVRKALQGNRRFRSPSGGSYDSASYDNFVSNVLPQLRLSQTDLIELVADKIRLEKFKGLLSAAVTPSPVEVEAAYAQQNEKVVAYVISESLEEAMKTVEVSEEKIKERYDENITDPDSLKTEEKRAIEYAVFKDPTYKDPKLESTIPGASPGFPGLDPDNPGATINVPGLLPDEPGATIEIPGLKPTPPDAAPAIPEPDPAAPEPDPSTPDAAAPETAPEPDSATEPDATPAPAQPDPAAAEEPAEESTDGGCQGEEEVAEEPAAAAQPEPAQPEPTQPEPAQPEPAQPEPAQPEPAAPAPDPAPGIEPPVIPAPAPSIATPAPTEPATPPTETPVTPEATPAVAPEKPKVLTPEEKKALTRKYGEIVQGFLEEVRAEGADFATIAKRYVAESEANGVEVEYFKTEEPFTRAELPESLKTRYRIVQRIFDQAADELLISPPPREPEGFWVMRLTSVEKSRDLTLDEAREQIKEALSGSEALDGITAKLEEAKEKLAAEAKDGPAFKAAAEEMGFTVERVSFERTPPAGSKVDFSMLRSAVNGTVAGQVSDVLTDAEKGGMLVYVAQKSLDEADETAQRKKDNIAASLLMGNPPLSPGIEGNLFRSWLQEARQRANPQPPVLQALQR